MASTTVTTSMPSQSFGCVDFFPSLSSQPAGREKEVKRMGVSVQLEASG